MATHSQSSDALKTSVDAEAALPDLFYCHHHYDEEDTGRQAKPAVMAKMTCPKRNQKGTKKPPRRHELNQPVAAAIAAQTFIATGTTDMDYEKTNIKRYGSIGPIATKS